jgi:hypothetical protein
MRGNAVKNLVQHKEGPESVLTSWIYLSESYREL